MAAIKSVELQLTAIPMPPARQAKNRNDQGFKYRGTLFRPSSAAYATDNASCSKTSVSKQEKTVCTGSDLLENSANSSRRESAKHTISKRGQIQSAKGRLERNNSLHNSSLQSISSSNAEDGAGQYTSVINLNSVVDVPDMENEILTQRCNRQFTDSEFHHTVPVLPSSAKASFGYPVTEVETKSEHKSANSAIRPAVYGLKLHRQVFGSEHDIMEAWANVEKEFPFRLSETTNESNAQQKCFHSERRLIPTTLKPLQHWLRHETSQDVLGLHPEKCLLFLSCDYEAHELPEVPSSQGADEDLSYSCIVATPRLQTSRQHQHHNFDDRTMPVSRESSHTPVLNPGTGDTQRDISFLLNPPLPRCPQRLRQEITELENLLNGVGSLDSKCSFVQFQAEINMAKARAKRLMSEGRPEIKQCEQCEPADTFGLLKFTKEHDEVMKLIRETRGKLVVELARLEEETKA